ncbi:hypothetical protein D3C71_1510610 [compost metagenome]
MNPLAKSYMIIHLTSYVKYIGIRELLWIPVCQGEGNKEHIALPNLLTAIFNMLCCPTYVAHFSRSVITQNLLDSRFNQFRIILEHLLLVRIL